MLTHGVIDRFYDYDTVVVKWADGELVTYKMGDGRTGYRGDSALAHANRLLSAHAAEAIGASDKLDRDANP